MEGENCENISESEAVLKEMYLAVGYIDTYIDGNNYNSPI